MNSEPPRFEKDAVVKEGSSLAAMLRNYNTEEHLRAMYAWESEEYDCYYITLSMFKHQLEEIREYWSSLGDALLVDEEFDTDDAGLDMFNRLFVVGWAETEVLAKCLRAAWRAALKQFHYDDTFSYWKCPIHEFPRWMQGPPEYEFKSKRKYPSPSEYGFGYKPCDDCDTALRGTNPAPFLEELILGPAGEAIVLDVSEVRVNDGRAMVECLLDREHLAEKCASLLDSRRLRGFFDEIESERITEISNETAVDEFDYSYDGPAADDTLHLVRIHITDSRLVAP